MRAERVTSSDCAGAGLRRDCQQLGPTELLKSDECLAVPRAVS